MSDPLLAKIRDLIQEDVGQRGLAADPKDNLLTACPDDFEAACRSLAEAENPAVAIVTGFFIPHAKPPSGETDGPLGAVFLARALVPLGIGVVLVTDGFCVGALQAGLLASGLANQVPLVTLPDAETAASLGPKDYWQDFIQHSGPLTHLIALERVGPSHTLASLRAQAGTSSALVEDFLREVPEDHRDRCHSMRGRDITSHMSPAHWLLEAAATHVPRVTTMGIGDGGNEIGMGKVPWGVIHRNIPRGGLVACRAPADHLIVCGVSNWGAYGLAAGVRRLRSAAPDPELFAPDRERELLRTMVEQGPLVDGVTGQGCVSVDGLAFERYIEPLRALGTMESP